MSDDLFRCDATAKRATEKALLVELETGDEVWVPQSVIHDDSEVYRAGDAGELVVLAWFARKQGWE
jgi:hypothetical protein